jgi:uncharacterized membrane protein
MHHSGLHYFPVTLPFLLALAALFGLLLGMVAARLLHYASESMGIGARSMFAILLLSLLLSYVNIPIADLPQRQVSSAAVASFFGVQYVIPVIRDWPATILAVNVGGAVVPILLSLYLVVKNRLYDRGLVGTAIVTIVCHFLARPVPCRAWE